MLIVDAQVHIWSQGTPSGQHRQVSSYTAEDCLKEMGEGGVAAAVLHPPRWDPNDIEVRPRQPANTLMGLRSWGTSRKTTGEPVVDQGPEEHGRAWSVCAFSFCSRTSKTG
jgi:hypothetical protein